MRPVHENGEVVRPDHLILRHPTRSQARGRTGRHGLSDDGQPGAAVRLRHAVASLVNPRLSAPHRAFACHPRRRVEESGKAYQTRRFPRLPVRSGLRPFIVSASDLLRTPVWCFAAFNHHSTCFVIRCLSVFTLASSPIACDHSSIRLIQGPLCLNVQQQYIKPYQKKVI